MQNKLHEDALKYHSEGRPGKIEIVPTKPYSSQRDLSLAYSPGVAEPCLEIEKDNQLAYKYTSKGNLVAVISNGTAVLGLGDIGAVAGKPVMEGKALLFKIYAGIDVFDIEINEKDPEKFIEVVKSIAPTFGGINLEDIKAPECFKIEERLKAELDIPVMHDDQHGTAIISAAGLINSLEIVGKKIDEVKIVVNGAGAAANSCAQLYILLGAKKENIVMLDSRGVISVRRTDINERKRLFATALELETLEDALVGADVFLGLSVADVLTVEMLKSMNDNPIVFALANPNPEISYDLAMSARTDMIFATGRSDYPNQINNVLGFPYIFRGALDVQSTAINEEMKVAAVKAIAELTKKPVPDVVNVAYGLKKLSFGRDYIIPKPLDTRLLTAVAPAVAKAAIASGVARKNIDDWDAYDEELLKRMGLNNRLLKRIYETARSEPKKVVFSETNHVNMLKAAEVCVQEAICQPILLGNEEKIANVAAQHNINLSGIEIINLRHDREEARRLRYGKMLSEKLCRDGFTYQESCEMMFARNSFGLMMVESGDADAMITGVFGKYEESIKMAKEIIGVRDGYKYIASMHIVNTRRGVFFLADTLYNREPSSEAILDVARLAHSTVKYFAHDPVMALLSYSNFGDDKSGTPLKMREVVEILHRDYPEIVVDGEMQFNVALNGELRDQKFPFNTLKGRQANTFIFPNLTSSNVACMTLQEFGKAELIGPIQMGLKKPVHILDVETPIRQIVNMAAVAVVDAIVMDQINEQADK